MKRLLLTLAAASALRPLALDVPRGGIKKHAGALGAAGLELAEDMRPGAHHGVALLAGVLVVKTCVSIWEARE